MDALRPWALCALVLSAWFLPASIHGSLAFERPVHAFTLIVASIAALFILISRSINRIRSKTPSTGAYTALPLDDIASADVSRTASPTFHDVPSHSSTLKLRLAILLLAVAVCLRIEIARGVIKHAECTGPTYAMLLPLLLALLDFWVVQRKRHVSAADDFDQSMYEIAGQYWAANKYRNIIVVAVLSISSTAILHLYGTSGTSYICPATTSIRRTVPALHNLSLPLDFAIAYSLDLLLHANISSAKTSPFSLGRGIGAIGWACLLSSVIMCIEGVIVYALTPDDRNWMTSIPKGFIWGVIKLDVVCCILALSTCFWIFFSGILTTTAIITFTATSAIAIGQSFHTVTPFPPASEGSAYLLFCCLILGFLATLFTQTTPGSHRHHQTSPFAGLPFLLYGSLLLLVIVRSGIWIAHQSSVKYHPIDMLIYEAKARHAAYVSRASLSRNLPAAAEIYKERYSRKPPPAFDRWYEYARNRDVLIIDDFDRIYADLLPFWALSPAEIRERTWLAISNPWNDVAGISIRNGKASISPNVMPTHRWMLDGIIEMINHFGEFLPDMDLGFNVNDEPRVAAHYADIKAKRDIGRRGADLERKLENSFSGRRAETWKGIPEEGNPDRPFREMSFQRTFAEFGSAGCEPGSRARSEFSWDPSQLCVSCAGPHSLGGFLANWTMSADICYQPDMANLHGLYLSPAAFKASHELLPIFSQSKASEFNDILYPSAWNYMDKVRYDPSSEHPDPPFDKKTRTLFWRGATSEGVSPGSGTWKGMSRQRFIHLANNINRTTPDQAVLLPYPIAPKRGRYQYTTLSASQLTKHIPVDVKIVDSIARCGGQDCDDEAAEFYPLAHSSDFQVHWSYKYLLDLDGAGFSGRFLAFLSSRSLPFKAALFREWYDSRLTPWLHFVPLDLRGQGFWATLLYFSGIEGVFKGKNVGVRPHDKEAEMIAEKGREWAGQVLRKQDMEVYMFRLLLEWGRLTDDRRDEIGYEWKG